MPVSPTSNEDLVISTKTNNNQLPDLSNKTILIVEDEESNYMYLKTLLTKASATIIHSKDGKNAVEIVKKTEQIDLILMDLKMPVMNGYDACEIIKKSNPQIPIIAQTAYAMEGDKEKVLSFGFDDYLSKPISKKLLFMTISKQI